jgi:hypothetical protein
MKTILYVSNESSIMDSLSSFKDLFSSHFGPEASLEIVDVVTSPNEALRSEAFATPMLIVEINNKQQKFIINLNKPLATFTQIEAFRDSF